MLTTILKAIAKRRKLHTERFKAFNWQAMQQKDCDVKGLWQCYTLTADGMRKGHKCFNCGKASAGLQYLMPCGKGDETEYFCSEDCRVQFGILKGTT